MSEFRMPSLGADMEHGTVVEWLVQPGARVRRGDLVAVIDTEKATIEIEIFEDGVIEEILVPLGEEVAVGTVLARLAPAAPAAPAAPVIPATNGASPPPRVRSSPLARSRAASLGVDLATLAGTGPGGAISDADVGRAARPTMPAPAARHDPADRRGTRQALATLMARSKREIPHYYLSTTIDMSAATAWLAGTNADRPPAARILPAALLLRASALAARAVPDCNGFWRDGDFRAADFVHLGVAINLRGGGVVAPAIHDADRLSIDETMARLRDLVHRARAGGLRASEISDQTITVTNLGDQGAETVFGVIYPPQVALIGFGRITQRPWAANGMLGVRPVLTATLAGDHRANDGHQGGLLLAAIDRALNEPENQ